MHGVLADKIETDIQIISMVETIVEWKWRFKVIKEMKGRFHVYFLNTTTYQEGHRIAGQFYECRKTT